MRRTVAEATRIDLITRRQYRHFALALEWRYGLIAPQQKVLRPIGSFNTAHIVVRDSYVGPWLNDVLVVAYALHSVAFAELVAHSKFDYLPGFAREARGHIALQHHGDSVWFRHLHIRPLPD